MTFCDQYRRIHPPDGYTSRSRCIRHDEDGKDLVHVEGTSGLYAKVMVTDSQLFASNYDLGITFEITNHKARRILDIVWTCNERLYYNYPSDYMVELFFQWKIMIIFLWLQQYQIIKLQK